MAKKMKAHAAGAGTAASGGAVLDEHAHEPSVCDELTENEIAARAYSYWEARGFEGGSPENDWYRAVRELEEERQK